MAQDPGSNDNGKPQEVDIDELEVEVLILAKNPKGLAATCTFLSRRGWPTSVMGNLSKGIEYIAEKRPDFVMVSLNHPSPSVMKLPDLISQTFNLTCIGFMESGDALSTQKLTQAKLRYKVFGAPSGPNFQRTIRRILAEKFNVRIDDRGNGDEAATEKAGSVTVRGSLKDAVAAANANKKEERGATEGFAAQVFANEDNTKDMQITQEGIAGTEGEYGVATTGSVLAPGDTSADQSGFGSPVNSIMQEGHGTGKPKQATMEGTQAPEQKHHSDGKHKRKSLKELTNAATGKDAAGNLLFGENLDPNKPPTEEAPKADLLGLLKQSLFGDDAESVENTGQSVLEKATESALAEVCRQNPDIPAMPLKHAHKVGVFPIDSATGPGYLVLALETGAAEDEKTFLKRCENSLIATFQKMGVPGKLEPGFWLQLPGVLFDPWASHAGSFSFKIFHEGMELGVAFFPTEKPMPKPALSADKSMYAVDIKDLSTEQPVTFKAYIHLKQNQKYFLYLRNGRRLQPEQKERLQEQQIQDIFTKTVDLENVRMFFATVFLLASVKNSQDAA